MNNKYWMLAAAIAVVACAGAAAVVSESSDSSAALDLGLTSENFEVGKTTYVLKIRDDYEDLYLQPLWSIEGGDKEQWTFDDSYTGGVTGSVTLIWGASSESSAVIVELSGTGIQTQQFAVFASQLDLSTHSSTYRTITSRPFSYPFSTTETLTTGPMVALNCSASSWVSVENSSLTGTIPASSNYVMYRAIVVGWSSNPTQFAYKVVDIRVDPAISLSYGSNSILAITGTAFERTPTTGTSGLLISYVITGNPPTGVSVNASTGVLSGSNDPAIAVGTYTLKIMATSTSNTSNSSTVSIKLTVDPVMTFEYSGSTFSILTGASISATAATNVSGGTYVADWGGISGLSINSSNGAISGKPDKSGTVTVTVSKSGYAMGATTGSQQSEATLTVYVQNALTASASASTLYLVTGKAIPFNDSSTLALSASASDGAAITWAIKNAGSTGLTVTSAGVVGGTAGDVNTSGSSVTFICTSVLNGLTQTKEVSVSIVIKPVLAFTSAPANAVIS